MVLWRYMDFWKFALLLETGSLYFPSACQFDDPFEGSLSKPNADKSPRANKGHVHQETLKKFRLFIKDVRPFTLVSCWTMGQHESAAMWKLYSNMTSGVAIKTNLQCLRDSLPHGDRRDFYIGKVVYGGHINVEDGSVIPFIHKLHSFEHEHELRVVSQLIPHREHEGWLPPGHPVDGYEYHEPNLREVLDESQKYFPVNLSTLVHELVVSPSAPESFLGFVRSLVGKYNLDVQVNKSSLRSGSGNLNRGISGIAA